MSMVAVDIAPPDSKRDELLAAAIENLAVAGASYVRPVVELMRTLLTNVLNNPTDQRVCRVKLDHPQVASMLGEPPRDLCGAP